MVCRSLSQYRHKRMICSVTILGLALVATLIAYIAFSDANARSDPSTVRYAAIILRHGDRSPTATYPNDPHKDRKWHGGLGALSLKGSRQCFDTGANLRDRYFRLLPSNGYYTKDLMFVYSSYAERCIMSAQSFLAGFMPPLESFNPLPIRWQPIPVNSVPRERDNLVAQKMPCAKYDEILDSYYTDPPKELLEFKQKNAELYAYLSEHTGANISAVSAAEELFNTLLIERDNKLQLPEWTNSVFPDKLLPSAEYSLALLTNTPYMSQVKTGPLLTDIIKQMTRKRNGEQLDNDSAASAALDKLVGIQYGDKSNDRNIVIYSGHDVTLVGLLRAFGVIEQASQKPDYASALGIELHQSYNDEDDHEVKLVYYFNSDDKVPKTLKMPNCEAPCTFKRFVEMNKDLLVTDFAELCKK